MDDYKYLRLKAKSVDLLNIFYVQNDYKYKFGPEMINDVIVCKDKLPIYSPKSCKYFKKIVKLKNNKNAKGNKNSLLINDADIKAVKKIQDEQNVNDALQEATVLERIALLKKKGIWTREALPKVMEPARVKVHWDYLLEEVEWLSVDMKNRFYWKTLAAKIIAENAKSYVFMKEEIKALEFIQMQEEARLHCSRISNLIKEWWRNKTVVKILEPESCLRKTELIDSAIDLSQIWLSKSLINAETSVGLKMDANFDRSDSDSVCSFNSSLSYRSIMLTDDDNEFLREISCGLSDISSSADFLDEVDPDELQWLESNIDHDTEEKYSYENEIKELKILSQMPLEKIIDENYFLTNDIFDIKSTNSSEAGDSESLISEVLSQDVNDFFSKTAMKMCSIISQGEKIQLILNLPFSDPLSVVGCDLLEKLFKKESINRNMQVLSELVKQKLSFACISQLQCGDDRLMISVLLGYLSYKINESIPQLIITSRFQIHDWHALLKKTCPNCKIIVLDKYLCYNSVSAVLDQIANSTMTICIISYSAISSKFCMTSVKWDNVIYDQIGNFAEHSSGIPEHVSLSSLEVKGIRVGLISGDNDLLNQNSFIQSFFHLLYSPSEVNELLSEIQYSVSKRSSMNTEILNTVFIHHCFPLQKVCEPENLYQIVMCELTPFQQTLHQSVVSKLRKSLESNNLLDFVESICQDILLSQHPFLFDCNSDNELTELFHSYRKINKPYSTIPSTYYLSNNDRLSYYLPRKVSSSLSCGLDNRWEKISKCILPYYLCDSSILGFTKNERLEMKKLLISTTNADYSLNKISACLGDMDEDVSSNFHTAETLNSKSKIIGTHQEFLSTSDLEILRFELKHFSDKELKNFLNKLSVSDSELKPGIIDKDLPMSATLAARRSKTKYKSRLTNISKENEKYITFMDCSDSYGFAASNLFSVDLNIGSSTSDCLEELCTISRNYIQSSLLSFKVIHNKVVARAPKLVLGSKSKVFLARKSENSLVSSISNFFNAFFSEIPKINNKLSGTSLNELKLSGKLHTLNYILTSLARDSSVKSCIIISHSLELLNMIETLIFVNNNYGVFLRLRLNSYVKESDEHVLNLVAAFNKCQLRNRKSVMLMHSRTNDRIINLINAESSSVIIADSHWQTDSDQLILKIINRWGLNSILSQKSGITSLYKLCSFNTLEQYLLTNDLSFLYDNTYSDSHEVIATTTAIVCQQSLLKNFVDKLLSPLKEQVISGFCIDDLQGSLQKKSNIVKVPNESIIDLFNSFESPYDLLKLCDYHSQKKMQSLEFCPFPKDPDSVETPDRKYHYIYSENLIDPENNFKQSLRNWEINKIKRQKKLKYLMDVTEDENCVLFYDQRQIQMDDSVIWMPPKVDDSIKMTQSEILDMYEPKPIRDTELSINLIPTKSYIVKSNQKKWDEKISHSNLNSEVDIIPTDYLEIERAKKRKLSNDFSVGDYTYTLSHQKKRKIFSNRRYFTENETNLAPGQNSLKSRYKLEKKSSNENEMQVVETKDILDIKKSPPVVSEPALTDNSQIFSVISQPTLQSQSSVSQMNESGRSNSILLSTSDNSLRMTLQRPFYSKEGLRTLKIKRQQMTSGHMVGMQNKSSSVGGTIMQNYIPQQRPQNNRTQLFLNTKFGSNSDIASQSTGESEYDKLPEWNIHEEAVLYQNICHFQDHQFSSNNLDKTNSLPNFKICEHYLSYYSITNTHRSNEMCKIHFSKLQMGFLNQNKCDNSLSRINKNSSMTNPTGVLRVRAVNETRPVIAGVTGRKLKIKMKNSIGTYGTSIFGSSQAMTNKIKNFQSFLNDRKVNLTQTTQIVNSCLNSFDSKTNMTFKMLDEVVNISKHPSLLPNHSQTIKKNATHISALEEHNIRPDKIFTPAMLIQRREEIDKERESESSHANQAGVNRQQILTSVQTSYRNIGYFETNSITSNSHSLSHIRRTTSGTMGNTQNLYSLQTAPNNQIVSRTRYNMPINRQVSATAVIHQQTANQIPSTVSAITSNIINSSSVTIPQSQTPSLGSRSQSVQFQIQHTRSSTSIPRRNLTQPVIQRVYPGSISSVRQNQILNRGSTPFYRPLISPQVVTQSNTQSSASNNSILTVLPGNTHDQTNAGINRSGTTFNINNQIRGHNVRTNIATVSSSSRGNINQIPRMLHVNQINRGNINISNRNQHDQ